MPQKTRFGDRYEGRRLRTLDPVSIVSPYIMKTRSGSQNLLMDEIKLSPIDEYLARKKQEGFKGISYMHVIVAAYIRAVSQYPSINRFISGQRIYKRDKIVVAMTIKQKMSIESPDTAIKVCFEPDATIDDVYYAFEKAINDYREQPDSDFDSIAGILRHFPGLLLKFFIGTLCFLDYFGLMPTAIVNLTPFHSSMYKTNLGSLGIPPVYHHLYNFGNVPIFLAFGAKKRRNEIADDGSVIKQTYIDLSYVLDERICDGYYFGAAYKFMRKVFKNPSILDEKPESVAQDID